MNSRFFSFLLFTLCLTLLSSNSATAQSSPEPIGSADSKKIPFFYCGRLEFKQGDERMFGTATVASNTAAVTSAQNLFSADTGFKARITFQQDLYVKSRFPIVKPKSIEVLAGYEAAVAKFGPSDLRSLAKDLGVLRFQKDILVGFVNGRAQKYKLSTAGIVKQTVGYGQNKNADKQVAASSDKAFSKIVDNYYTCNGVGITQGMLGGPVFVYVNGVSRMIAIIVSGDANEVGVKALNERTFEFVIGE